MIVKGDVVKIQAEWETESREGVVLQKTEDYVLLVGGENVYKNSVKEVIRHMDNDELFNYRQNLLLAELPEEFRGAVSYKAYEDGHSAGHDEVINYLMDLVEALKKPIAEYTKRITDRTLMKLTHAQADLLKLIQRSSDHGEGWRHLSKTCQPLFAQTKLDSLVEFDGPEKVRLTEEGKIVLKWL